MPSADIDTNPRQLIYGSCPNGYVLTGVYYDEFRNTFSSTYDAADSLGIFCRPLNLSCTLSSSSGSSSTQKFIVGVSSEPNGLTYLFSDGINNVNNITISGSEVPSLNMWHHIAFTFD